MSDLITISISAEDYPCLESCRLAQWCKTRGADEWTVMAISVKGTKPEAFASFDAAMAPFRLPNAVRECMTASRNADLLRETELWKLTSASFTALKTLFPDGIFTYDSGGRSDTWFENLTLYRQGELMLGVVSHEAEGVLRVTAEERQSLEREGFKFRAFGTYVGY